MSVGSQEVPWTTVPIFGTWLWPEGNLRPGTYSVHSNSEVTNEQADVIFPMGLLKAGALNTDEQKSMRSFEFFSPAQDDGNNFPQGWRLTIRISPAGAEPITFELYPSLIHLPNGIDLQDVVVPEQLGEIKPVIIGGVPGGFAKLDAQGRVLNAAGIPYVSGDGELSDAEMLEVVGDVTAALADQLEPPIDLVLLYENAKV